LLVKVSTQGKIIESKNYLQENFIIIAILLFLIILFIFLLWDKYHNYRYIKKIILKVQFYKSQFTIWRQNKIKNTQKISGDEVMATDKDLKTFDS
jgi:hypothetical protein